MMKKLAFLLVTCLTFPAFTGVISESQRANAFFDKVFDEYVARHPESASQLGLKTNYDKWDDISDEAALKDVSFAIDNLARFKREFDVSKLDTQTRTSFELYQKNIEDQAEGLRFLEYSYPVNQMYGRHTAIPTFLINIHRIDDVKDAKAYIARLKAVPASIDQLIVLLKTRADHGIIIPKFVFPLVLDASEKTIQGAPFDASATNSPLLDDILKKVGALKENDTLKKSLIADATNALKTAFKPAYEKLIAVLKELETRATEDDGAWKFPNGAAFYEFALRKTTTTDWSAQKIHDTGLKEVARIHDEMRQLMKRVGFAGDLQAFFKFMREDKRFYFPDTDAGRSQCLALATKYIDTMRSRLDELFKTKPKAELVVKAVEAFREQSAGKAFYQRPAPDGSRPGMFYVNLREIRDTPTYSLEALAYHEGLPGHHMQIAIAQELRDIPKFRKFGGYTAYTEGWGLYTELIPKEIGLYQDPYSDFGRLSLELWRAARLVVDTGIHWKKWTRSQATQYLIENTPNAETDCIDSINRYIVMPSQATAYKIGMIKILELREWAKAQLGTKFDIRSFHDAVLTQGALPLDFLEKQIKAWVATQ